MAETNDLDRFLAAIKKREETAGGRGLVFERAMARLLPIIAPDLFSKVYMLSEWPKLDDFFSNRRDIGIDLVGWSDRGWSAIQCKFYDWHRPLDNDGVSKFLSATLDRDLFPDLFLVTTSAVEPTKVAQTKIAMCKSLHIIDKQNLINSRVDWSNYEQLAAARGKINIVARKRPRSHQRAAIAAANEQITNGLSRGQIIMPCGTGKTLVGLWLAEMFGGPSKAILYVVPSLSLMRQTLDVWRREQADRHDYLAICSDKKVAAPNSADIYEIMAMPVPVTTDPDILFHQLRQAKLDQTRIVLSTYQSLPVLADAIKRANFAGFELALADEAHNTTGVSSQSDSLGAFQMIHKDEFIPAAKRIYMTATPRLYKDKVKKKAYDINFDCFSMDDLDIYGPEVYKMNFKEAIEAKLLSDYEILLIEASHDIVSNLDRDRLYSIASDYSQRALDQNKKPPKTAKVFDEGTIVTLLGCWDALADPTTEGVELGRRVGDISDRQGHLRSAIAFTGTIFKSRWIARHDQDSDGFWEDLNQATRNRSSSGEPLRLNVIHVDGTMPANVRERKKEILETTESGSCNVLSNSRVFTEGVDVPALDAVIFLDDRQSVIDIVQAVGRVMRRTEDKKKGYVIIPIVVPPGKTINDETVFKDGHFQMVWNVVNALRAHDDRVTAWATDIKSQKPIRIIRFPQSDPDSSDQDALESDRVSDIQRRLFQLDDDYGAKIASRLADRCGDRKMWPTWGEKAAVVCSNIQRLVEGSLDDPVIKRKFDRLHKSLKKTISEYLTTEQVIEMASQHIVTHDLFDRLFTKQQFKNNPVGSALSGLVDIFPPAVIKQFKEELRPLNRAYASFTQLINEQKTFSEKVDLLREIYNGFFKKAMPETTRQLGIVYTPIQVVDSVLRLTNDICKEDLGWIDGLGQEGVNILEPFAGTGTFLSRLLTLQSGGQYLIKKEDLQRKFSQEIHGTEIVLLAYYIAITSITAAYEERLLKMSIPEEPSPVFPGMVFGNTLMNKTGPQTELGGALATSNEVQFKRQNDLDVRVIIGNPPWSAGKKDATDEIKLKLDYSDIEKRVSATYKRAGLRSGKIAGNLFVKAIRWASDRLANNQPGVIAFVHPVSLANGAASSIRAGLMDEFSDIYMINLRGNIRGGKQEGEPIFADSTIGVAITFFVRKHKDKNLNKTQTINIAEVAKSIDRAQKLDWLKRLQLSDFKSVLVDESCNWLDITGESYKKLLPVLSNKSKDSPDGVVHHSQLGIATNMDDYVYDWDRQNLEAKIKALLATYKRIQANYNRACQDASKVSVDDFISPSDPTIKWTDKLKKHLAKGPDKNDLHYRPEKIRRVLYRPFIQKWLYADEDILSSPRLLKMFTGPNEELAMKVPNATRGVYGSPLATDMPSDLNIQSSGGGEGLLRRISTE